MKTGWKLAFVVIVTLFSVGLILYLVRDPPGEAIELRAPPTPLPILVHVSGGILVEGVYSLPIGSRVMDVIDAAGGFTSEANPNGLNLAAYLEDGEHVIVPTKVDETELYKGSDREIQDGSESSNSDDLININTASQKELETLPGIGPVLAQEIIAYREVNGLFQNIEELLEVKGIAYVKYDQIRELITVGDVP